MITNVAEWSWLLAPVSSNCQFRPANGPVPRSGYGWLFSVVERVAGRGVDVGPQVVLEEVVVVQDAAVAVREDVLVELRLGHRAVLAAFTGLREAEVAELEALGVLPAGVLAGVEQLAALVEEVADVDHLVDGEPRRAGAGSLAGQARHVVVGQCTRSRRRSGSARRASRATGCRACRRRRCRRRRRSRPARRCTTSGSSDRTCPGRPGCRPCSSRPPSAGPCCRSPHAPCR